MPVNSPTDKPKKAPAKTPRKASTRKKPVVPKKAHGRPSGYSKAMSDRICNLISTGITLRSICREPNMPGWRTVYDWAKAHPDFSARLAHARELGFDAIAESTLDIVDEAPRLTETEHGYKVDTGHVSWQKNRVEQRMKLLAVWSPRFREKAAPAAPGDSTNTNTPGPALPVQLTSTDPLDVSREYQKLMGA